MGDGVDVPQQRHNHDAEPMMPRFRTEFTRLLLSPSTVFLAAGIMFLDYKLISSRNDNPPILTPRIAASAVTWNFASLLGFAVVSSATALTFSGRHGETRFARDVLTYRGIPPVFAWKQLVVLSYALVASVTLWVNLVSLSTFLPDGTIRIDVPSVASQAGSWLASVLTVMLFTLAVVWYVSEWVTSTVLVTSSLMVPYWLGGDSWTRFSPTSVLGCFAGLPVAGENRLFYGTSPAAHDLPRQGQWAILLPFLGLVVFVIRRGVRRTLH